MEDERVLVPPEVHDGLEALHRSGDLDPDDRERSMRIASDEGHDATAKWIEQVGESVYARAARGEFEAQTD